MQNDILAYYQQIRDGRVTVGKWIELEYTYLVKGLESKAFFFNAKKAGRAIRFIESFCHHCEGRSDLIHLELWQRAALAAIFGIVDADGLRIHREVVMVMGRKNGKSLFAAAVIAYCLFADGEYGAKIYCVAPKLTQADIVYSAFKQTIAQEPELQTLIRPRKMDMYVAETNSSVQAIAFNAKKSDGFNPHLTVCDEIASWPGDQGIKQYEVMSSGRGARKQPLLLSITTAGYVNEGIYDELVRRCTRFLLGDSSERRLLPLLYMIDDAGKWNDINELAKANPNLGVSISTDYLLDEIAIAEGSLAKRVEFLTKYGCIKQNASTAWLESDLVERCRGAELKLDNFRDTYALGGIDLSQTTDLTAAVVLIERDGIINVFTRFWLPSARIDALAEEDGVPYRLMIQKGLLFESGENFVNYEDCRNWFIELVQEYQIYPLWIGYDRYSAQELVRSMEADGFHMDSVHQGENLTGIINTTEGLLRDGRFRIGANDLMAIHMLDCALKVNGETGRKRLIKMNRRAHIDGMAALLDAMCMRAVHWDELGEQLQNKD